MIDIQEAAQKRAAGAHPSNRESRTDRPRDRRRSADGPSNWTPVMRARIEIRAAAAGDGMEFAGYASVTEAPYEMWDFFGPYTELVAQGAFAKTLAQPDLDVPLVLQHDSLRRIARTTNGTLQLSEDDQGLLSVAQLDPADVDVAYIAPKMRAGLIDEMSFMFSITAGQWSPDYTEYRISSVDIHRGDVAIVGYGANPATAAEMRSEAPDVSRMAPDELRRLERSLRSEMDVRGLKPAMTLQDLLAV